MNFKNDFEHVVHLFNEACEELDQQKARIRELQDALRDAEQFIAKHSGNGETEFRDRLTAVLRGAATTDDKET